MALSPQERSRRMRLNMLMAMSYAVAGRSAWTPSNLFAAGEQGAWYDPSDFSTMFQDEAGTTPVTAVEQPVGLILDKSMGLALGAEAISNGTFDADITGWSSGSVNTTLSWVDGEMRVLRSGVGSIGASLAGQAITLTSGKTYAVTLSLYSSNFTGSIRVSFASTVSGAGTGLATATIPVTTTKTSRTVYLQYNGTAFFAMQTVENFATNASIYFDNISVKEIAGNHASQTTSTSRPVLKQAADGRYYLLFDGTDDFLVTGSIDPGACDKIQAFAGIRKVSDAAQAILFETSTSSTAVSGATFMLAPANGATADYSFRSKGTVAGTTTSAASFSAPITNVLSGLGDISGDTATLRVNGVQVSQATTDQGTGNFLSYPLYIGRRGGSSLPFNGQLYGLILRFSAANLSSETITKAEAWMNTKTGAY